MISTLTRFTRRPLMRIVSLFLIGLFFVTAGAIALRGVSADSLNKFGITEQSRVGKFVRSVVPQAVKAKRAPAPMAGEALSAAPFATLTVTSGADSGAGTLRNQIAAAAPGDTIVFSGVTTVTLTSAELLINKNLTINGGTNGVTVTRSGATQFRIFNISNGFTVSMSKLTISNGNHASQAGGVQNSGTLTMTDCAITGNTAGQSGGIQNDSVLTMTNCTISGNSTSSSFGAGVLVYGSSTTLTNCTFTNNNSALDTGAFGVDAAVTATLTNCTIVNNSAAAGGGGGVSQVSSSANIILKNTIVVNNTAPGNANILGNVNATSANNLIGVSGTGGLTNGTNGNQVGVTDPDLGVLANNGGYTQTIALLPGSPAINAGTATGAPTSDQRGIARVGATDIGAFESRGFTISITSGNNQSATTSAAFASPLSVTVTSANGEPVNGGEVNFTPPGSGASATIAGSNPATITSGVATTGTVTANSIAGGPYNVAATANGATPTINFSLTNLNPNTPPTITAQAGVTRNQGSGSSNSQIAIVNDTESGANGVTVTVNSGASATVNGVTVSNIVNSSGTVTANIVAICGASNASFTLTATDGNGATATATLNVTVTGIAVTPTTLVNGLTFVSYSATLSATGGTGNYTFSLVSGTLPAGLTLSGNTITGVPTTAGAETFTIRADDDGNTCFGERSYTLIIGSTGLMYYPLSRPVRLLDTRAGASPNACYQPNAPIAANGTRTQQARGTCEGLTIPSNATTLTGNITVVQPGGNGFLTMFPSDAPQPTVANSNFVAGEVLNNAFTVGIGAKDGAIKIFTTQTTHVVVDVTGYYAPPGAGGLYFHPLPKPIRLLETRSGFTGCFAPAAPLVGGTNTTQVGTLTCDGVTIPAGAQALVGNATTVNPQAGGYLTLYPADAVQPFVASSNYATGQVMNGPFTVGLSPSGDFKIFTNKTTDLVIDIMGYFSTQMIDSNGQGLLFNSLGSPLRLLDTRNIMSNNACYQPNAPMTAQAVYTQETQIPCTNLTPTARALIGNVTVVAPAEAGWLTFWPSDAAQQPTTATSNYTSGQVFNRYFTVGLGPDAAFKRYSRRTTEVVIDISGFFAP